MINREERWWNNPKKFEKNLDKIHDELIKLKRSEEMMASYNIHRGEEPRKAFSRMYHLCLDAMKCFEMKKPDLDEISGILDKMYTEAR